MVPGGGLVQGYGQLNQFEESLHTISRLLNVHALEHERKCIDVMAQKESTYTLQLQSHGAG